MSQWMSTTPGIDSASALVGESPKMTAIKAYLKKLAATDTSVLITGETGTGKELIAHHIHQLSNRRARPMVCINCAAIPDTLLESELFGYEAGAFTGAQRATPGKLQLADDGDLFLDEIGDMSPLAQAKMLRALETREAYRLGGRQGFQIRCRFLAATNQALEQRVADGLFRKDLFYRLGVARVQLPPLRERTSDIPLLLHHFIQEFNIQFGAQVHHAGDALLETFAQYSWPGNVRELRNLIEAVFLNLDAGDTTLESTALPEWFHCAGETASMPGTAERALLLAALQRTNWNKSKAAQSLHWSRMTLYRKMARYQIHRQEDTVQAASA